MGQLLLGVRLGRLGRSFRRSVGVFTVPHRGLLVCGSSRRHSMPCSRRGMEDFTKIPRSGHVVADQVSGGGAGRATYSRPSRSNLPRSEEHTSELQSLMRISYAVFCLKKKK